MRVKELKMMLEKMPEDSEVLIRARARRSSRVEGSETVTIGSATPIINSEEHKIILNPLKTLRLNTFQPEKDEEVFCTQCTNYVKLDNCKKKGKVCATCTFNCPCKQCSPLNSDSPTTFAARPMYVENNQQ